MRRRNRRRTLNDIMESKVQEHGTYRHHKMQEAKEEATQLNDKGSDTPQWIIRGEA